MDENARKTTIIENDLQSLQFTLPFRTEEGHKGSFGKCVIIGGSSEYVGAPRFAALSASEILSVSGEAAMRSGAGTTTLVVPDFLATALYPVVKYSAIFSLPSEKGNIVFDRATAKKLFAKATAAAIGPGMADGDAEGYLRYLLVNTNCNAVLDADGLKCVEKFDGFGGRVVITPHIGEMSRICGKSAEYIAENAAETAKSYAAEKQCIVVLKGHVSYISDGKSVYVNRTGNSRLSKGGSGDVLSGIIAGLLAWKVDPLLAARVGAYALGRSAEFSHINALSHLPDDLMSCLPLVFDELQGIMRL